MNYISQIFDPLNLEHAKNICLTPDSNDPNKFENETKFFIDFIKSQQLISAFHNVVDYGCGMGRNSKRLIEEINCSVTGIDISQSMLLVAKNYVNSENFTIKNRKKLDIEALKTTFDIVISTFVLQHSRYPEEDMQIIKQLLKPNGIFILVNENKRFLPVDIENNNVVWHDDKKNIKQIVSQHFTLLGEHEYYNRKDKCLTIWNNE